MTEQTPTIQRYLHAAEILRVEKERRLIEETAPKPINYTPLIEQELDQLKELIVLMRSNALKEQAVLDKMLMYL